MGAILKIQEGTKEKIGAGMNNKNDSEELAREIENDTARLSEIDSRRAKLQARKAELEREAKG